MSDKNYTLEDIKMAYADGYYEGTGDDAWYRDHKDGVLVDDAMVERALNEYIEQLTRHNAVHS